MPLGIDSVPRRFDWQAPGRMARVSALDDADGARAYGASILRGEKVYLRELRDDDLPLLVKWWNDPQAAALQTLVVRPQPESTIVEKFRAWSANQESTRAWFTIVAQEDDGLVGSISLFCAQAPTRAATLAISIGPEHWSRGLGTDALRVMVRYGFQELGLNRIGLGVWAFNDRAIAAYRKAGFVEEGRRRQMTFHAGRFHDEVLMRILRTEWDEASA
jgi:RimJ/RimL family protein N-acetyltransferase